MPERIDASHIDEKTSWARSFDLEHMHYLEGHGYRLAIIGADNNILNLNKHTRLWLQGLHDGTLDTLSEPLGRMLARTQVAYKPERAHETTPLRTAIEKPDPDPELSGVPDIVERYGSAIETTELLLADYFPAPAFTRRYPDSAWHFEINLATSDSIHAASVGNDDPNKAVRGIVLSSKWYIHDHNIRGHDLSQPPVQITPDLSERFVGVSTAMLDATHTYALPLIFPSRYQ